MALNPTILQDAIIDASAQMFSKFESRRDEYSVVGAANDYVESLVPKNTIESVKASKRHVQKIPVLNRYDATVLNARACDFNGEEQTSAFSPITWTNYGFAIEVTPSINADNYISVQQEMMHQMEMGLQAVFDQLDADGVAFLEANKATVGGSTVIPFAAGDYTLAAADKDQLYKRIPALMKRENFHSRQYIDIANTESLILEEFLQSQGAANATNSAYQFSTSRYDFRRTNSIVPDGGVPEEDEVHYFLPVDSFGILNWVNHNAKMNEVADDGRWYTISDPIFGFDWGVHEKRVCADKSAYDADATAEFTTKMEISASFGYVKAYDSDGNGVVRKVIVSTV